MSVGQSRRAVSSARLIIASVTLLGLAPSLVQADTLRVPSQFPTIQAALTAANPGDTVLVAPGTYQGPGNADLDFAGKAVTLRGEGGAATCIIDCAATPASPKRGIHFRSGETPASILEGFTIRRGATPSGAIADTFNGAGILLSNQSSPTIRNCIVENNHAGCWGGGISCNNSSPIIEGCIIRGNLSDDDGGGLFCWNSANPTLINCVISGNAAPSVGGGISNFGGTLTVVNCTIAGNASNFGAGVYGFGGTITNSVIWGNTRPGQTAAPVQVEGNTPVTHSNIQGGRAGAGNINAAPGFKNAPAGDYDLLAGSAGIDAGSNTAVPAGITLDLARNARIRDGDADSNAIVDMGAYEFPGTACAADISGDGAVTVQDIFDFLAAYFAGNPAADFNHSGAITVQDIFDFLAAYFAGCP